MVPSDSAPFSSGAGLLITSVSSGADLTMGFLSSGPGLGAGLSFLSARRGVYCSGGGV